MELSGRRIRLPLGNLQEKDHAAVARPAQRDCGPSCFGISANRISARSCSSTSSARSRARGRAGCPSTRRVTRRCGCSAASNQMKEECRDARGTGARDALRPRHAARRAASAARLALHRRRRAHPRPRDRRQHRDLQRRQRHALPSVAVRRSPIDWSRSTRTTQGRRTPAATRTRPIWTWRRPPTCSRSMMAVTSQRAVSYLRRGPCAAASPNTRRRRIWRCSACGRRSGRWFNAGEERPGAADGGRRRSSGVDDAVWRGSGGRSAAPSTCRACR